MNVTQQLRELGFNQKQIKSINNHLLYDGIKFKDVIDIKYDSFYDEIQFFVDPLKHGYWIIALPKAIYINK